MDDDPAARSRVITKHTIHKRTVELPEGQRIVIGMSSLLNALQGADASTHDLNLPEADAAKLRAFALTEPEFIATMREASLRDLETICSWGDAADAVVIASAIMALDESEESKKSARYGALLESLSAQGRARLKAYLLSTTANGSSSTVDLVALAGERPDVVTGGNSRRCAALAARARPASERNTVIKIEPTQGDSR